MLKGDGGKDSAGVWFTAIGGVVLLLLLVGAYGLALVVLVAAPVGYVALVGQGIARSEFVESFVGTPYERERRQQRMRSYKDRDRLDTAFKRQRYFVMSNEGIRHALKYELLKEHTKIGHLKDEYAHDRWVERYNTQSHWAHRERKDARRSPSEVLGFLTGVRHREEDLERAFFSTRFTRVLDSSGYARLKRWKIYGEEGLARREVALWLGTDVLSVEFAGETLARYEVQYSARTDRLREVKRPRLFETAHRRGSAHQPRLFELADLGEGGWLKALKLGEYAPRRSRRPQDLQGVLFAYGA